MFTTMRILTTMVAASAYLDAPMQIMCAFPGAHDLAHTLCRHRSPIAHPAVAGGAGASGPALAAGPGCGGGPAAPTAVAGAAVAGARPEVCVAS